MSAGAADLPAPAFDTTPPDFISTTSITTDSKPDVMNRRRRRSRPQCRQQGGFAKCRQFFQERRVRHRHVEHSAPHLAEPCLAAVWLTHRGVPGVLQLLPGTQPAVTPYGK